MMKQAHRNNRTASLAVLAGLACLAIPAQGVEILREEFTVPSNSPFDAVAWSAYFTKADTSVVDWSAEGITPGFIGSAAGNNYAFFAPAGDATFNADGPGLIFTTLARSHPVSSITSIATDENMDASLADPASARFVIEVGGQWYASEFSFSSETEDGAGGPFNPVSLDGIDFADGANWRLLTVAVGEAGIGEITLAGATVGGTLSGDLTSVGVYSLPGNGGDHSRFDNFVVTDDTQAFVEDFLNATSADLPFTDYGWTCLLTENDEIVSYAQAGVGSAAGVARLDYAFHAPKQDAEVANDPALVTTAKPGTADISTVKLVSWDSSADNFDHAFRVALQVDGVWYASDPALNDGVEDSGTTGFVPLEYSPASFATASNWLTIENTTVGDPDPISLGAAPGADLSGTVTAYGLYLEAGINDEVDGDHVRFDNFSVVATFTAQADPAITSFTSVGGSDWEATITGRADTGYEFYSATDLNFAPGTLVTTLSQDDPTNDPGTVTGGNLLTTDGDGNGKVRMTLSGDPAEFVRAQTAP